MIHGEIGGGGMATVHLGRLMGASGFSRTVAIKRLYPQYARDPVFASMFLDEARLASRVHHPNVVSTLDVANEDNELLLVMEYVHGETLAHLVGAAEALGLRPSPAIVCAIITGTLYGLHAAHTATSESGEPLGIVHRDISPQNIMVGADGAARVLDFGVAKASMRSQTTSQGQIKGKLAYMAPEQLRGGEIDQRTDIFATGVVLWEALTGRRLFKHDDVGRLVRQVLKGKIPPPSHRDERLPRELDRIVMRALARSPGARYGTPRDFATALERVIVPASPREVGEWVSQVAAEALTERSHKLAEVEKSSARLVAPHCLESSVARSGPVPAARRAARGAVADAAVPAPVADAPRRRRRFAAAAVLGVVAMVPAAVLVALADEPPAPDSPPQRTVVDPVPVAKAPPASPQPAAAEEPPTSPVSPTGDPAEPPSAGTDPPKPPAASPPSTREKVARTRPAPRTRNMPRRRSVAKPNCNPPYRIDEDGIRRIRPECLR